METIEIFSRWKLKQETCNVCTPPLDGNIQHGLSASSPPERTNRRPAAFSRGIRAREIGSSKRCCCEPRGHFAPRGPLAYPRQSPLKLPRDQNLDLSGVKLFKLSKRHKLVKMQFRDLLCVEPVHHGRGLGGLGSLRSQFMETEAFQVRLIVMYIKQCC